MLRLKSLILKEKFNVLTALCALITCLAYLISYCRTVNFNLFAVLILTLSFVLAVVFLAVSVKASVLTEILPYILFFSALSSFMFYVYGIYYYVSVVLVGIDLDSFSFAFILCTTLFALNLIVSVVNLFAKRDSKIVCGERQ